MNKTEELYAKRDKERGEEIERMKIAGILPLMPGDDHLARKREKYRENEENMLKQRYDLLDSDKEKFEKEIQDIDNQNKWNISEDGEAIEVPKSHIEEALDSLERQYMEQQAARIELKNEMAQMMDNMGPTYFHDEALRNSAAVGQLVNEFSSSLIREDATSPSGYSKYVDGFWKPYVPPFMRKKKKKKKLSDEVQSLNELANRKIKIDKEEALRHAEMLNIVMGSRAIILEAQKGYALIAINQRLSIQTYIEKGPGFQPYESTDKKEYMILKMLRWGQYPEWGPMARKFEASIMDYEIFTHSEQLRKYLDA